jgi:type I restriction enzyme, S subunit
MSESVPEGWAESSIEELLTADCLFSDGDWVESKDQDPNGTNRLIQLADIGDGNFRDRSHRFMNDEQFERLNCTEIKQGDILIARMPDPIGRATIFPKIKSRSATVVDIAILRASKIDSYWLMSVINSSDFRKNIEENATGTTRIRIGRNSLSKIKINCPPLPEQKKIASILTSVDEVIEKTQSQIDKLQDLKKATMNELLTKGIGHTEFKDSALGRIPKSWEVKTLEDISTNRKTKFQPSSDNKKLIYVGLEHMISETKDIIIGNSLDIISTKTYFFKRDTLFGKLRPYLKKVAYPDCDGICSTDILALSPKPNCNSIFLFYVCASDNVIKHAIESSAGNVMPRTSWNDLAIILILFPPLNEQKKIASILTCIDKNIETKKQKLSQTQSLKKSLMQDLLTGKVRVSIE